MKLIGDLLARFQNLTPPHGAVRKALTHAISDIAGMSVPVEHISIQHRIAFIKTSSIAKNVIRLRRGEILARVFEELPKAHEVLRDIK